MIYLASRVTIGKGIKFLLHNRKFKIVDELENDVFVVKDLSFSGVEKKYSLNDLLKFHTNGELVFEEVGKNTSDIKEEQDDDSVSINRSQFSDFSMLPDELKQEVENRFEAIKPLLQIEGEAIFPYIKARAAELKSQGKVGSERTLYRWYKDYQDSRGNIFSLIPAYYNCGSKGSRQNKEVDQIIEKFINDFYNKKEAITVKTVSRLIRDNINSINKFREAKNRLTIPSQSTIRRRIKEQDPFQSAKARYGAKFAKENFGMVNQQEKPKRPLERVEFDHTPIDLIVVDDKTREEIGRPWLTYLIDCCSGSILGFYISFEHPSYISVMQALKHAIAPKDYVKEKYPNIKNEWLVYGLPEKLVVDNGKEFLSKDLDDACKQLNIELFQCPVKSPWYKGTVERSFRTFQQGLIHQLPGTTFSNTQGRKKREYQSEKKAVISFSALIEIVHRWIIDVYSEEFNSGVKGIPKNIWKQGIEFYGRPHIPASRFDWTYALMKIDERTIGNEGIRFNHLKYQSHELQQLRSELEKKDISRVKFKYDPEDLSRIFVYDDASKSFIEVPGNNQKYTKGLSLYIHRLGIRKLNEEKKKVDEDSIAAATTEIFEIAAEESKKTRRARKQKAIMEGKNSATEIKQTSSKKETLEDSIKPKQVVQKTESKKVVPINKPKKWGSYIAK